MTAWLRNQGHEINHKRVERLMGKMGIKAIYPKRNLSKSTEEHKKYPYLLKDIKVDCPNKAWASDITYIPLHRGYIYLVAIMDWYSRYVLSWEISNTLDTNFCLEALEKALQVGKPEIFNTDQGSQFTSNAFTSCLLDKDIKISMDGKGRAIDNIFIERLWRSVKYEEVYLHDYETVPDAVKGIGSYFGFYNYERFHQSLNYETPATWYFSKQQADFVLN
jgi:putative transposase